DLTNGFLDGTAEVPAAHRVFDGDIAGVGFAIDFRTAVGNVHFGELGKRNALAGWREETNPGDGFGGVAVLRQIPQHQVVALLADQDLGERAAADGGLNSVLNVGDIDSEAGSLLAIHGEVQIRLAEDTKQAKILHTVNA